MPSPTAPTINVAPGYKFAVLAVAQSAAGAAPRSLINLGTGFAASDALPAGALVTWENNIGRFHRDELAATNVFLWALRRSRNPAVLDHENDKLARRVYQLYLGLLIASPYFANGRLTLLTGANEDGEVRARSLTTYNRTYRSPGIAVSPLTVPRLKRAAELALALVRHSSKPSHRAVRSIRAFRQACEAVELDLRLHQFVRCLEGFVAPPFGKSAVHFADRVRRLCVGRSRRELRELYAIRSSIEHLHGPYDRMPKSPKGGRVIRLLQRCIQAEATARYFLLTYLLHPGLRATFANRAGAEQFWSMDTRRLRRAWPTRLGFASILRGFSVEDARRELDPA